MPVSSRRCGMITRREAERLCKSFLGDNAPPRLPDDFAFGVYHECAWGCRGSFLPARYNSSRAKCIKCAYCGLFFSPNKFIFHSHRVGPADKYVQPDAANFNSWRRHMRLSGGPPEEITHAWEDVKAMFNGGTRKRLLSGHSSSSPARTNGGGSGAMTDSSPPPTPSAYHHLPLQSLISSSSSSSSSPKRFKEDTTHTNNGSRSINVAVAAAAAAQLLLRPTSTPTTTSSGSASSLVSTTTTNTVPALHPSPISAAQPPNASAAATLPFSPRSFMMDYMWKPAAAAAAAANNYPWLTKLSTVGAGTAGDSCSGNAAAAAIIFQHQAAAAADLLRHKQFYNASAFRPVQRSMVAAAAASNAAVAASAAPSVVTPLLTTKLLPFDDDREIATSSIGSSDFLIKDDCSDAPDDDDEMVDIETTEDFDDSGTSPLRCSTIEFLQRASSDLTADGQPTLPPPTLPSLSSPPPPPLPPPPPISSSSSPPSRQSLKPQSPASTPAIGLDVEKCLHHQLLHYDENEKVNVSAATSSSSSSSTSCISSVDCWRSNVVAVHQSVDVPLALPLKNEVSFYFNYLLYIIPFCWIFLTTEPSNLCIIIEKFIFIEILETFGFIILCFIALPWWAIELN